MAPALGQVKRSTRDKNGLGKPTWDIALWYPMQGDWTEDDFLAFDATAGNRMIELAASKLLKGFKIAVSDVFAAGDGKQFQGQLIQWVMFRLCSASGFRNWCRNAPVSGADTAAGGSELPRLQSSLKSRTKDPGGRLFDLTMPTDSAIGMTFTRTAPRRRRQRSSAMRMRHSRRPPTSFKRIGRVM